ncbi:MAG: thioredoxin family protein [Flavobacteriia bacterium]|nr:thioredoxin family protein [Flavobacteriia bacterium]
MKKILALALFIPFFGIAQEVNFTSDWEEAVKQSKVEKKPLFIDFYTDWCVWCKVQDSTNFVDPTISAFINENYIPVKLNAESAGAEVALRFRPMGYPTVVVYDPNSESPREIRYMGYTKDKEEYLSRLQEDLKESWETLGYDPLSGSPEFPDFIRTRYRLAQVGFPKSEELATWFNDHGNMTDEVAWSVVQRGIYYMDEGQLAQIEPHFSKYEMLYGKSNVNQLKQSILYVKIRAAETEESLFAALEWAEANIPNAEENRLANMVNWYGKQKMWNEYIETLATLIEEQEVSDEYINSSLWTLIEEECQDRESCKTATEIMAAVVEGDNVNPNHIDTFAWLLYRAGETEKAKEQAERAIAENGGSMESSEELLTLMGE